MRALRFSPESTKITAQSPLDTRGPAPIPVPAGTRCRPKGSGAGNRENRLVLLVPRAPCCGVPALLLAEVLGDTAGDGSPCSAGARGFAQNKEMQAGRREHRWPRSPCSTPACRWPESRAAASDFAPGAWWHLLLFPCCCARAT